MIRFVAYPYEFPLHVLVSFLVTILYPVINEHIFLAMGTGMKRPLVGVTAFENSELHSDIFGNWRAIKSDDDQSTRSIEENSGKLMWFDSLDGL